MEIATLTREDGKTKIKVLKQKEVEELIKRHEAEEAKAEKDKKDKEQKEKDKWATSCFCTSCHQILYCFVFYIKSLETAGRVVICILVTEEIWNRCNASLHGEINCANKELTLNFSRKIGWTEYYT